MEGIRAPGNSQSGLDVRGLVDQLITAEGAPMTNRLDRQEIQVQSSLSALGTFQGALSEFQNSITNLRNADDLQKIMASSSDEDAVAITATNIAQEGSYEVQVDQLAQSHRLMTEAFESDLDPVGEGSLTIQFGSIDTAGNRFLANEKASVKNVFISAENNSLRGIEKQINDADAGLRASIVNDGRGHRLVLSAEATGSDNSIRITVNDSDGTDSDQNGLSRLAYDVTAPKGPVMNLVETTKPQDALLSIDGINITSSSNDVSEAIDGVVLSLNAVTNNPVRLKTEFDNQAVVADIEAFIASYNEMISIIQSISGVNEETGEAGPLAGDASVRGIFDQIRRVMTTSFSGVNDEYESLASVGIETQRDGSLSLNAGKLQSAIDDNLNEVAHLFARSGSTTDPLLNFAGASNDSRMGRYAVNISQQATQGRYAGNVISGPSGFSINEGDNALTIKVDGATSGSIRLDSGQYANGQEIAAEIQRKINQDGVFQREGIGVNVQFVVDQLVISSNRFGSSSRVEIVSSDDGLEGSLGLDVATGVAGEDVRGTIGREAADTSGRFLTGRGDATGIRVEVLGGKSGQRGEVNFSQGVAEQLNTMLSSYLEADGILSSRNEGFNRRIDDINRQRDQLARRLDSTERRYLNQFSSLDTLLGKMKNTSAFLENQLAGLPGAKSDS